MKKRQASFGIKEIAIVLAIIGILFIVTVPNIVKKYLDDQSVYKLKASYSTISGALKLSVMEYDDLGSFEDEEYYKIVTKHVKLSKTCGVGKNKGCFGTGKYKKLNGQDDVDFDNNDEFYKVIMADGTAIALNRTREFDDSLGELWMDVNGPNKPNQIGIDTFLFSINKDGRLEPWCNLQGFKLSDSDCNINDAGTCCSHWVIQNQNIDYKYCNDLAWGSKTSCK